MGKDKTGVGSSADHEIPSYEEAVARCGGGPVLGWGLGEAEIDKFSELNPCGLAEFVQSRVDEKMKVMAELAEKDNGQPTLDLEIRIELMVEKGHDLFAFLPLNPPVWRTLCLSSAVKLGVFQDKILCPVMGWTRNYHAYAFHDARDGAVFCAGTASGAIDARIGEGRYCKIIDPLPVCLGLLLREKGDYLLYEYDLDKRFFHKITLERVIPEASSKGACVLLDGAMRCPDEDGGGCEVYQQDVLDVLVKNRLRPPRRYRYVVGTRVECNLGDPRGFVPGRVIKLDYRDHPGGPLCPYQMRLETGELIMAPTDTNAHIRALRPSDTPADRLAEQCSERAGAVNVAKMIGGRGRFNPLDFNLVERQTALARALGGPGSVMAGAKMFEGDHTLFQTLLGLGLAASRCHDVRGGTDAKPDVVYRGKPGIVQHIVKCPNGLTLSEDMLRRPDDRDFRLCCCGSPLKLMACAKCKSAWYCSKACQRSRWKTGLHKGTECAARKADRDKFRNGETPDGARVLRQTVN